MQAQPVPNTDHYVGRFRVLRVLGRGSEGVVYLASDPKLGREVAIKTASLGESPDPFLAELLVKTASTASKLSHPNIVPVFEAGMHEGSPYVVFEYVEGRTVAQMLSADGPMPLARAVVMMSQILAGVAQIHERSLIPSPPTSWSAKTTAPASPTSGCCATSAPPTSTTPPARCATWRPNASTAAPPIAGAMSTRWGWCSTRCSPANR
jgi:hypothetical protein